MREHVEERREAIDRLLRSYSANCSPHQLKVKDYLTLAWKLGYEAGVRDQKREGDKG